MSTNGTAAVDARTPATALISRSDNKHQSTARIAESLERVLISGDLAQLSPADRISYYRTMCESLNLNPLTRPFEYITLNGKLTLYAKRDCTDQLRFRDRISIRITGREVIEDIYIVTARASTPDGREDESTGAVPVANLKGEARSNAYMKAETKAKRRATLSICGLGMLEEIGADTIPGALKEPDAEVELTPREAQQAVAERRIAELKAQEPAPMAQPREWPPAEKAWKTRGEFKQVFAALREAVGETAYHMELAQAGVQSADELRYLNDARKVYERLTAIGRQEVAQ